MFNCIWSMCCVFLSWCQIVDEWKKIKTPKIKQNPRFEWSCVSVFNVNVCFVQKEEKRKKKRKKTKQRPKNGDFNEIGAWGGGQWNDLEGLKWTICCCCRRQCCLHFLLLQQGMKKNECMKEGRKEGEKQKNKKQTSMHRLCAETVGISWGKIKWQQKKKERKKEEIN